MKTTKGKKLSKVETIVEVVPNTAVEVQAPDEIQKLKTEYDEKRQDAGGTKRPYSKRKTKADEEARAKVESLKSDFSAFGGMILEVVCPRLPNPLPPTTQEKELFGNAVGRIIEKYAPQLGGYDAELALAVAIVVVFVPRMRKGTVSIETPSHSDPGKTGIGEVDAREKTDLSI